MNLRKGDPYVSCIKIRGVPIIPPLMTEDIRMEMRYYKHLALAVEERLKKLENLARSESDLRLETITQNSVSTTEDSSNCEEDSDSHDKTLNAIIVSDVATQEASLENNFPKDSEDNKESANACQMPQSRKSSSDEETSRRDENLLGESASSDVITASTDINQYLNDSFKSDTIVSTLENSPEMRKPEVPKTLDIVPIIVDATVTNGTTNCHQDLENFGNITGISLDDELPKSTIPTTTTMTATTTTTAMTSSESEETTPKLMRQGSYVLDSPSPMLLAHLEEEKKTIIDNYVPSSSSASNSLKRKEWNISQAKSEWELQRRKEAFVVTESSSRAKPQITRVRRNSASNVGQARTSKYSTQTRTMGKHFDGNHQIARSADCIQSMLYRESTMKNTKSSSIAMINGNGKETTRSNVTSSWKSTRSVSILSLANKLSGSLGSLATPSSRSSKRATPQKQQQTSLSRMSKSFENETPTRSSENFRGSTQKLLSAVTSEKLVYVFKEIQNTHERQMTELVQRQQREQRNMQKEFEKQQILLLAQIEKTFPGICLPRLAEKIATPSSAPIVAPDDEKTSLDGGEKIVTLPKRTMMNGSHGTDDRTMIKCPLDDIYPREKLKNLSPNQTRHVKSTKKLVTEPPSPPIGLYSTSVLNGERKNYAVSRQLFPLEGRTKRLPVLNNATYGEKHQKAATVINAYARGYLVRRIMQTERVIALKSTYGEALHCMLKLHVDAPLALPELNFHQRLQLQCDAASMNIVELFSQETAKRMEIIKQDRQIKRARQERPNSARSCYSFATQRTLARKRLKEMGDFQTPMASRCITARTRCQTWTSNPREKRSPSVINQGIKRSTSAGAVRKPWR